MQEYRVTGEQGEEAAARFLVKQGYNIVERNWRAHNCEIDIIAKKRGVLVFVEVKTRSSGMYGSPEENVDAEKIRNILFAASSYVHIKKIDMDLRFDIISVIKEGRIYKIKHYIAAFDESDWKPAYD